MKVKLPIIGQVRIGKDAIDVERVGDQLAITTPAKSKNKFFDVLGGLLQFNTQRLSSETTVSTKLLQANKEWVYRNNDAIAQEVSKMEFELYSIGISGGEIVYNEVETHPLLDLLDKPNQETTKADALYVIQSHKKLTGDAFWVKLRSGGRIVGLRTLPPDKVKLNLRPPTSDDPTVIENFQYTDTVNGNKIDVTYQPEDIIHFKKPNPNNPFRGLGAVESMADTIDVDNLVNETSKNYFKNGAITNFVLSTEARLQDDQLRRLQAELKANYAGSANAYKTMILGGGLRPEKLSFSNRDMEFLGQLEWYRDKIMIGFGNTKASLGIVEDVNRANAEATLGGWLRSTVKPDMEAIINTLNEFLVPEFGSNLVLGFNDPVPEDRSDDLEEAKSLYQGGVIMRAEARELLGYESDETDNVYFVSNMGTLIPDSLAVDSNDEDVDQEIEEIEDEEE